MDARQEVYEPQSFTERFSVFSKRISFNGNNREIVTCFIA
jgi:hypothetical protein